MAKPGSEAAFPAWDSRRGDHRSHACLAAGMNETASRRRWLLLVSSLASGGLLNHHRHLVGALPQPLAADLCVYGGTASGVMAAMAAARDGLRVVLVEPSRWLGGMTGGGLNTIDWGRQEAVAGTTRVILKQGLNDREYRKYFADLLQEHAVAVVYEHRVSGVERRGTRIEGIILDQAPPDRFGCPIATPTRAAARQITADVFIDCSYEGDLMARAGVGYTFGRESRETYGESLAGVQPPLAVYRIDPYRTPGQPSSGLLPQVQDIPQKPVGAADSLTMGYGFRWKYTTSAERLPIDPPPDYDPRDYELYRRGFVGGVDMFAGRRMRQLGVFESAVGNPFQIPMGNLSRALWAATVFGSNADYPDGDYATRAKIWKAQQDFVRGLTHFIRTDPAVSPNWREKALTIGLKPGLFDETAGYSHQLYVREARRMQADYVLTQADLEGRTDPVDAVGLASYGVDEWPYATVVIDGGVALAGGYYSMLYLEKRYRGIYKIPYRSIVPKRHECTNLLVPVCCSASHIAMTSIRMEPVWMIFGESAGIAAAEVARRQVPVQDLDYQVLEKRLRHYGQRIARPMALPQASPD